MTANTPARTPSDAGQTDPREVERLIERLRDASPKHVDGYWQHKAADTIAALREKLEAAERRAYELAVAIMGGEDAPGYADSIPTADLVKQQRDMAAEWRDAVPAAALAAHDQRVRDAALEDVVSLIARFERDWNQKWRDQLQAEVRALKKGGET